MTVRKHAPTPFPPDAPDRRRAPWLPSADRDKAFEAMRKLARAGASRPEIAAALGTTTGAISSYFWRYGITMRELRDDSCG